MQPIFRYWYLQSPGWFYSAFLRSIQEFENVLAVGDTFRNLGKPLFQDYTIQGRIIGFFLRMARIGLGGFIFLLVALVYIATFVLWMVFPLICLLSLLGSVLGYVPAFSALP
ncbi:hypothetical protein KGQ71_02960 [Patescibacteria group bacterium]|nr:hypothetical protein [Patescibacteria group bacterium]